MANKWVFCSKSNKDNFEEKYYNKGLLPNPSNDGTNQKVRDLKAGDQIVVYSPDRFNGKLFIFGIAEWLASDLEDGCYQVVWKKLILKEVIKDSNRGLNGQTADINDEDWTFISNWIPSAPKDKPNSQNVRSKNIIFYGPPGTGKTRRAKIEAAEITRINTGIEKEIEDPDGRIKLVQFHPSYSYFDFVEGIEAEVGKSGFVTKNKIFKAFSDKAAKNNNEKYVLIIDEINRGNVAAVFGELLYALEYRNKEINTLVGKMIVPNNLYIIGTMNTADVSISNMDYAVRRRFDFIKVPSFFPDGSFKARNTNNEYTIEDNKLIAVNKKRDDNMFWVFDEQDDLENYTVDGRVFISNLYNRVRVDIEKSMAKGIDSDDIMPGAAYFLVNTNQNGTEPDIEHLKYKIDYEIIPLLIEYAKNGLFNKRNKLTVDGKSESLYEMLINMRYRKRLFDWLKNKNNIDLS